jgi:hypothetical protein
MNMNMEGMTIAEIAKKMGLPASTIKQRLRIRGITPIGYTCNAAVYPASSLETLAIKLPRGTASPKWGKKRSQVVELQESP